MNTYFLNMREKNVDIQKCVFVKLYKNKKSIKKGYTDKFQHDIISKNYEMVIVINQTYNY